MEFFVSQSFQYTYVHLKQRFRFHHAHAEATLVLQQEKFDMPRNHIFVIRTRIRMPLIWNIIVKVEHEQL